VHPGAVAAAARAGLKIRDAIPRRLDLASALPPIVVTVCDRAHEEIPAARRWLHWSIPDPVESTDPAAFDHVLASIERRIAQLLGTQPPNEGKGPDDEQR
jgi:protein-tyrosine-phosphatase